MVHDRKRDIFYFEVASSDIYHGATIDIYYAGRERPGVDG